MKIYYKVKEIDYEKTLGELEPEQEITIPTQDRDISAVRTAVSRTAPKFPDGRIFKVRKDPDGAVFSRMA